MDTLIKRCCGLDVHQAVIVACLLICRSGRKKSKETRTFLTTTAGLLELRDWLKVAGCTHVGMESAGIYWRAVYALLEDESSAMRNASRSSCWPRSPASIPWWRPP